MNVRLHRCVICGFAYLKSEGQSNCPFCGVSEKFVVPAGPVKFNLSAGALCEKTKANAEAAVALEIDNAEFYHAAAAKTSSVFCRELFHTLAFVEAEHAKLLCAAINAGKPEISAQKAGKAFESDAENLKEALGREQNAIEKYSLFLSEASEPRMKTIFTALIEVEQSHLQLEKVELQKT